MTSVAEGTMASALDEASALLREDGASLRVVTVDEAAMVLELVVDFDGVDCEECVLPPDRLHATLVALLERHTRRPVGLVLHDPRAGAPLGLVDDGAPDRANARIVVLDPTGVLPDYGVADPGPAAGPLAGKTVAIRMDILWKSFDWTVEEWRKRLEAAGATVRTWRRVQGLVGDDYEQAQAEYEKMLTGADVAISGLANCGSCTSWSVRDALTASFRGLPTAAVATAHFEPLARLLARDGGHPGMRVAVLPYPYDTLPEDDVRAAARDAFPRLLEALGATV
jgi:hypothetical protein